MKTKWLFVLFLVLWLGALAATFGTLMIVYNIAATMGAEGSSSNGVETELRVAQVIIRIASVWMVVGWVPALVAWLTLEKTRVHK